MLKPFSQGISKLFLNLYFKLWNKKTCRHVFGASLRITSSLIQHGPRWRTWFPSKKQCKTFGNQTRCHIQHVNNYSLTLGFVVLSSVQSCVFANDSCGLKSSGRGGERRAALRAYKCSFGGFTVAGFASVSLPQPSLLLFSFLRPSGTVIISGCGEMPTECCPSYICLRGNSVCMLKRRRTRCSGCWSNTAGRVFMKLHRRVAAFRVTGRNPGSGLEYPVVSPSVSPIRQSSSKIHENKMTWNHRRCCPRSTNAASRATDVFAPLWLFAKQFSPFLFYIPIGPRGAFISPTKYQKRNDNETDNEDGSSETISQLISSWWTEKYLDIFG